MEQKKQYLQSTERYSTLAFKRVSDAYATLN